LAVLFNSPIPSPWVPRYYSLVSLGLAEKLMLAVYNEIHTKNIMLSRDLQADFLATQGVDKHKFMDLYDSVNVRKQWWQAGELALRNYQIDIVPTLVVAGRYKIGPSNNGPDGMATVLDYLVKQVQDKKL
jgi:protein dithiol oxidoreductase (disulfide-forming)